VGCDPSLTGGTEAALIVFPELPRTVDAEFGVNALGIFMPSPFGIAVAAPTNHGPVLGLMLLPAPDESAAVAILVPGELLSPHSAKERWRIKVAQILPRRPYQVLRPSQWRKLRVSAVVQVCAASCRSYWVMWPHLRRPPAPRRFSRSSIGLSNFEQTATFRPVIFSKDMGFENGDHGLDLRPGITSPANVVWVGRVSRKRDRRRGSPQTRMP